MDWFSDAAAKGQYERFIAERSDSLFRTGHLMTGNAADAEDLVQETLLRVARRWNQVRLMEHPAAYARRVLINLVLRGADRRSRQKAELAPEDSGPNRPIWMRPGCCGRSTTLRSSGGR